MDKYFDYAAATPIDGEVLRVMEPYYKLDFFNASALYSGGKRVRHAMENARQKVAGCLGVKPTEIIFTSGCTEANNLAIQGIMDAHPTGKILYSAIEHDAVRSPANKYRSGEISVGKDGVIDLHDLRERLSDDVVMVSVMYVNNEVGTVQPIRKVAKLIEEIRQYRGKGGLPLYLHVDAAQAPNTQTISIAALGADLMSLSGAKIYGPKGVGCLYVSKEVSLVPLLLGGGQERGLRSGTENVSAIVGFSEALGRAAANYKTEWERLETCSAYLSGELVTMGGSIIVPKTVSITSVSFPGRDNEYLVYALDKRGYSVASGSACHASSAEPSHVLTAIGIDPSQTKSVLRLSLGKYTSLSTIDEFIHDLKEVLANS